MKRYFFDQQSQVHQLQNTLANQRLSLSRTSLDDSQYAARFKRLDGLIADLALSIRKNWKSIPPWLQPGVNKEAIATGGKEMIVAGRAFLSCWLVEEVFDKYFHPDLEVGLSAQLKAIQQNIRRFAPPANNAEEEEALMSKIGNWRLATLEGLSEQLNSPQTSANRQRLVELLNEKLIASLEMYLQEPTPPELAGGVPMIIELAVGILMHLPLESRDVLIEYYPPGHWIQPEFMTVETGIAALTNPCSDSGTGPQSDMADKASVESTDSKDNLAADQDPSQPGGPSGKSDDAKRGGRAGMFGGLMANKKMPPGQQGKVSSGSGSGSQTSLPQQPPGSANGPKDDQQQQQRVRMAAGVSVRIRHRSVLAKAPVYVTP